ncbi:MAG: hypothetical protein R3Y53_00155 [Bacillota bacterium]
MIKKIKKGMVSLLVLFCATSSVACTKKEPLSQLEQVQKQLLEMEGYSTTATLTRFSNKVETVYETQQDVKITGEYRLELTAPDSVKGNYTLFDGERICQFNESLQSNIIHDVPESQSRNELFLNCFIENYLKSEGVAVSASTLDESKCIVLEAVVPNNESTISFEKLWIDSETLLPVRLSLYDTNNEERYRIDYNEFTYNPEFDESIFVIME